MSDYLRGFVRDIPDFPSPGIIFRDITPLLADARALQYSLDQLAERVGDLEVDLVIAAEARGFLLGAALAMRLAAGFVLARKPGRLPAATISASYALEYGCDRLELHSDAIAPAARVLVHDDLLATGGTAGALIDLTEQLGGRVVGAGFLIELEGLGARARLAPHPVHALIGYP